MNTFDGKWDAWTHAWTLQMHVLWINFTILKDNAYGVEEIH